MKALIKVIPSKLQFDIVYSTIKPNNAHQHINLIKEKKYKIGLNKYQPQKENKNHQPRP